MKYYKVVRRTTGFDIKGVRLFSLMYLFLPRELQVEYLPRTWVSGKLGPLFIFDDIHAAERFHAQFSSIHTEVEIWEVETENPREQTTVLSVDLLMRWAIKSRWNTTPDRDKLKRKLKAFFKQESTSWIPHMAPIGTMVADKVKLVRRVSK